MIYIISFTKNGFDVCCKLHDEFDKKNIEYIAYSNKRYINNTDKIIPLYQSIYEWTKSHFQTGNVLIFIGAVGIAVRAISKFIKNKKDDAAVLVIDEKGKFVIPILSGHIGKANKIAYMISSIINAIPVITTATDINNIFSVDSWAVQNDMFILNECEIKNISSSLLDNNLVGIYSEFDIDGELPQNVSIKANLYYGICISPYINKNPFEHTLKLIPKCINVGMGCKKNSSIKDVETLFLDTLVEYDINIYSIRQICSINIKKDEYAFKYISNKYKIPFKCYDKEQLLSVKGNFEASEFVSKITGVDNVCERASAFGQSGKIICRKKTYNGVTIALFLVDYKVRF